MSGQSLNDHRGGLKTVERALRVLEIVSTATTPPTVRDVSLELQHNISSTYNIVNTLAGAGYLSKDGDGQLRLGERLSILHRGLDRANDDARLLRPYVEHVNRFSGETVYLTRFTDRRVVIQSVFEGNQSLRVTGLDVGYSGSEDQRASGKAIMAFLDPEDVVGMLRALHRLESDDEISRRWDNLRGELQVVADAGFAFDNENFEPGICCIAAPYFGADGRVVGSLAASGPSVRADALQGEIAAEVLRSAREMSRALGAPSTVLTQ